MTPRTRKNAFLVQGTKVEAVKWTGSGDGIIAGGIETVLWKKKNKLWEIAWKFKENQPQNLVSATWSIEGPSATASCMNEPDILGPKEVGKCVYVCYGDGKPEYTKVELCHPQPVSMIQWRPSTGRHALGDTKRQWRHVLLTCCLDGTVRLWSEMDNGRARKVGKDMNDHKTMRRSFCVAAVIEINQALNGALGRDVFLTWATETRGMFKAGEGGNQFISTGAYEHGRTGKCEWLVGFGPGSLVTLWAIHCLDDISPLRFPRVMLWKKQNLDLQHLQNTGFSSSQGQLLLNKVVIARNCASSPPILCSLIHLSHCNSLFWSLLHTQTSKGVDNASADKSKNGNFLSCSASMTLNLDGHTGKILQVAIHPCVSEVELAISLDSNGLLLFWSLSTISNCISALPALVPSWKYCGKLGTQKSCPKYTSLRWAPSILDENRVFFMGHVGGIDCFIVKISRNEVDDTVCHYICTIPFTDHGPYEDGPTNLFCVPLSSCYDKIIMYNKFMLLGVWMKSFEALSWEITLHSIDLLESCHGCNNDDNSTVKSSMWKFETIFCGKRYFIVVNPCSSQFPDPLTHNHVTSFAVVCPSSLVPMHQKLVYENYLCSKIPAYTMATGFSDGSLKLWRSNLGRPSTSCTPWELVGMFVAHQGPVSAICLTDCGQKIATVSTPNCSDVSTLCIWGSVCFTGLGSFILEDTLSFDRNVVTVNWLTLENGQFLLGVCMPNKLQIYAQRHCGGQTLLNSRNSSKMQSWFCLAFAHTYPATHDFFWGHRATAIVVHESYLTLYSQWLFLRDRKPEANETFLSAIFTDSDSGFLKSQAEDQGGEHKSAAPLNIDVTNDHLIAIDQLKCASDVMLGFWSMLEISEKLGGSLPVYHPEALLINIYSGNWKRAYVSVRHLVETLTSKSEKRCCSAKSSHMVPHILLSTYFEGLPSQGSADNGFQWSGVNTLMTSSSQFNGGFSQFAYNVDASNFISSSSSKSEIGGFFESLENLNELPGITSVEKMEILAVIDLLNELDNKQSASAYENLDEPGRRFWVELRFQQLCSFRRFGKLASVEELVVDSRLIGWAFHSDCQETLLGSVLPNEPSWPEMRALGVGFWFTNVTQLRTRMEKLARLQYLKKKDPKDCALLYIALNRIQVLAGLFKISKDEKDKPLVGFLSRNFQDEKNKAAALKNAYVLLGRHQLELATAFFLLGGDAASAVTVCAKNLGDEQLALVICRLVEKRGGPLEHNLIIKFILPSAIDRGDYWLASLLEWELGNYSQSFLTMLSFQSTTVINKVALSSNNAAFMDPSIGLYCLTLGNKNSMRNAIGEKNAAILVRWATLMRATALNRCGLPLEALECLSSSFSNVGGTDQGSMADVGHSQILPEILKPSAVSGSSNWLLGDVALYLESGAKLDLALQYFSKLMRDHPCWPHLGSDISTDFEIHQYEKLLENFQQKLYPGLAHFEQRFSLDSSSLIAKILLLLCNNGLLFIGYDILRGYICQGQSHNESNTLDGLLLYFHQHKPLLTTAENISTLLTRFIAASSITYSHLESCYVENFVHHEVRSMWLNAQGYYLQRIVFSLWSLRAAMRIFSGSLSEDLMTTPLLLLDLFEYFLHFASAWLQRNSKGLLLMVQPLLITQTNGHTPYEVDMKNLKKIFHQISELVTYNTSIDNVEGNLQVSKCVDDEKSRDLKDSIQGDERWQIMGVCLWQHMSRFVKHKLNLTSIKLNDNHFSGFSCGNLSSWISSLTNPESGSISLTEQMRLLSLILAKLLKSTLLHISSYHVKQLALFLQHKVENGLDIPASRWLEGSSLSQSGTLYQHINQGVASMDIMNNKDEVAISELLWDVCADPNMICEGFVQEQLNWRSYINCKPSKGWNYVNEAVKMKHETEKTCNNEGKLCSTLSGKIVSPGKGVFQNEVTLFQVPKEICKRNGELIEALCINSIDQRQGAIASNRKGIVFFNWENEIPFRDESEYIWSDADWPQNGWAGSESTPVPTVVSPGVGLGSKKGAHLGLGGATIGMDSLGRPGRDLTGGGAFGIPGYAGIGASGLGWEVQDDFEEYVDPPATVENISTRAFSSHPSRPFFLVGSSNTHIYLWQFGKDKATATYGVLPAANVPPPYALASISALQFDHCGHRFASAALDGTVCTWQLEVGGRSNVRPMESSPCFNSHATDVSYITSSGSVIAASGYSSNGVNVVIWDTLAPPTSSRASIVCHEGGARSISVFDNDIGSGSVSPLIVTGGKVGDVGIHDFRYIATGRTKRHKHLDNGEPSISTSSNTEMQTGFENKPKDQSGMLWYIPKAHLGSVTRISTIPNTSLFLTGSKDGDVKLWDAKAAKLVYHWPKLHERHTFLQPSSRGFGGVIRAAVTDIQVVSHGFLTCGGDGSVKLVQLKDYQHRL
ncbi:Transducin family protein/WD-40 repeat protein [Melia azedarach]|uniref:Transducin family protein/WD-40 repeat protein n=1 Tax=Melia azedarach TaxID=155640 RepID=A0ACC1YYG8_MELAZ|nr:Transducin family protein/WD-40 repeat protein [Melia azedarach]